MGPDLKVMAVPVKTEGTFEAGAPIELFQTRAGGFGITRNRYDVTADGQTFVVNSTMVGNVSRPMTVVLNWTSGLRKGN